jgi:hypothetical protein
VADVQRVPGVIAERRDERHAKNTHTDLHRSSGNPALRQATMGPLIEQALLSRQSRSVSIIDRIRTGS